MLVRVTVYIKEGMMVSVQRCADPWEAFTPAAVVHGALHTHAVERIRYWRSAPRYVAVRFFLWICKFELKEPPASCPEPSIARQDLKCSAAYVPVDFTIVKQILSLPTDMPF